MFTQKQMQSIVDKYYKEELSLKEIADQMNTYPQKIRRAMKKEGYKLRDKSEAQKTALKAGRHTHPTEGKTLSEEVKNKIGKSVFDNWKNMSEEEIERRKQLGKEAWDSKTAEEKMLVHKMANEALQKSAIEGSKLEKFLKTKLVNEGYLISFHTTHMLQNKKLHIDILIEDLGIALEIDGPSHNSPIWGQESLQRSRRADSQKTGLLLNEGFKIIRIKYRKSISKQFQNQIWQELSEVLKNPENLDNITVLEIE